MSMQELTESLQRFAEFSKDVLKGKKEWEEWDYSEIALHVIWSTTVWQ